MIKNVKHVESNISIATVFFVFLKKKKKIKDDLIEYKCLYCNKNYEHKFDEKLKDWFFNKYKFSNHDNNNIILLLQKGVHPYK